MKALNFLHYKNIYYGDMKPENLLVFRNQLVKLDDFGVSLKLKKEYFKNKDFVHVY